MISFTLAIAAGVGCNPARKVTPPPPESALAPDEQLALRKIQSGDYQGASRIYSELGEGVLFDRGPAVADPLFDKALSLNASNSKALFYSAMTKPLVAMAGFLPRFEGLLYADDPYYEGHARHDLDGMNFPELYNWAYAIPQGQGPFTSINDVQRFLRTQLLPVLDSSMTKLAAITSPPALLFSFSKYHPQVPLLRSRGSEHNLVCAQRPQDGTWYCAVGKKGNPPRTVQLDKNDFAVISHSIRAVGDYIRLNTAYSTEGWELARVQIQEEHGGFHGIKAADAQILYQYPNLFTLEPDQDLANIKDSTYAALEEAADLNALGSLMCGNQTARIAANAFFASICVFGDMFKGVQSGLQLLIGPTLISIGRNSGIPVSNDNLDANQLKILVNVPAIIGNPPKDLKPLIAKQNGAAGTTVGFPDPTFGGLFPDSDFVQAFDQADWRADWNRIPERMSSYGFIPYPYK